MNKRRSLRHYGILALALFLSPGGEQVFAASAMWSLNPSNGDWNNPLNWSPATVPNGPADTATFDLSNVANVFLSAITRVDGIGFNAGASAYTITAGPRRGLFISGAGIMNNSGTTQNFVAGGGTTGNPGGTIEFTNGATAGSSAIFVSNGASVTGVSGGITAFRDTSTAGGATFMTNGGAASGAAGGFTQFSGNSTAGNGLFITNGGTVTGAAGGDMSFSGSSSAGSGIFVVNGGAGSGASGGTLVFGGESSSGNSTLIAYGGAGGGDGAHIFLFSESSGSTARVMVFGNGALDIRSGNDPPVMIGSLEGTGNVFLGVRNLTIGSNDLSSTFSGVLQGGDSSSSSGGSLTKTGPGTLTLTGANTYTGTTTVNAGGLIVNGSITSAVRVNGGILGGTGTVRSVLVNSGGILSPGEGPGSSGIFNVAGNLTLTQTLGSSFPIYLVDLNGTVAGAQYDQIDVTGGVNLGNAILSLQLGFTPLAGDEFTIIDNDGTDPVFGTFNGLGEGALVTEGGQTFAISYQGSDGNDVVLTSVVPEPATWALLSTAGAVFLANAFRRRRSNLSGARPSRLCGHQASRLVNTASCSNSPSDRAGETPARHTAETAVLRRLFSRSAACLLALCLSLAGTRLHAASALWNLSPANSDWNDALNWTPAGVPNGPADIASFGPSNVTSVSLSANTEVERIVFHPITNAYTITARPEFTLTISGAGITNDSLLAQNFVAGADGAGHSGAIAFTNSASAGSSTRFTAQGSMVPSPPDVYGGSIFFRDSSTAGSGTFHANGGASPDFASGGLIAFYNNASAGNGMFTADGSGVRDSLGSFIEFHDTATAAHAIFVNQGGSQDTIVPGGEGPPVIHFSFGAQMTFRDSSSAGEASFTNNGGTAAGTWGSMMRFRDSSAASSATITNNGGTASFAIGGITIFSDSSSAGNATIINNGGVNGGETSFQSNSTADNATLIANDGPPGGVGGRIRFQQNSEGWTARVQLFGDGALDISAHNDPGLTIGSLEGSGRVFLGGNNLTVGSNNQSTGFSGVLRDGSLLGSGDTGGSLTKIGAGTLVLSGANTYTGTTTIEAGSLILNGSIISSVSVNGGTLSGSGTAGAVTVNSFGTLSPGDGPGILSVVGDLTLTLGSTYLVDLNGAAAGTQYDQTDVAGAVILGNATLSLNLGFTPAAGDAFTIIKNDGTDVVIGTFNGLAEGLTFTAEEQTFTISYAGGTGNDVVLTSVIPEPATWAFFGTGAALLAPLLRRRRIRS